MKPIIILFEDRQRDRFIQAKKAAKHLNYDIFPDIFDRGLYIKDPNNWIDLLFDRGSSAYILIDHELGRKNEDTLTENDITEIIIKLEGNRRLIHLFPDFLAFLDEVRSPIRKTEWNFQLALIIMKIVNVLKCKACVSCSAADYGSLNFKEKLGLGGDQPDQISINSEISIINWINGINKNDPLKNFQEKTYGMDIHDLEILKIRHGIDVYENLNLSAISLEFYNFTGYKINALPDTSNEHNLVCESLKTLIGKNSIAQGGERPASILSIYLLLIGAVKFKDNEKLSENLISISDITTICNRPFLPFQKTDEALATLDVLFQLFSKLVVFKKDHEREGSLCLLCSSVSTSGIKLYLEINLNNLKEGILQAINKRHCGDVSSLILKYVLNNNDTPVESLTCLDGKIELKLYQDNFTELTLKPWT